MMMPPVVGFYRSGSDEDLPHSSLQPFDVRACKWSISVSGTL